MKDIEMISMEVQEKFNAYLDSEHKPIDVCGVYYPPSLVLDRVDTQRYNEQLMDYINTVLGGKYD